MYGGDYDGTFKRVAARIIGLEIGIVNPLISDPNYDRNLMAAEARRTDITKKYYDQLGIIRPYDAYDLAVGNSVFGEETKFLDEILKGKINKQTKIMTRSSGRSGSSRSVKRQKQRGGTYKPAEYHGGDSGRYTASPAGLATGAYGTQVAVSQGVLHGDVAGPNLSWSSGNTMTGGKRTHRRRKSAKTRKQKAGGCGCAGGTNKKAW